MQVVDVAVSGDVNPFTLKQITERVRAELTATPGITQVDVMSAPPYEISIEVPEDDLRRTDLTFEQAADAARRSWLDLPGGVGTGDQSAIETAALTSEFVEEARGRLVEGISLTVWKPAVADAAERLRGIRVGCSLVLALFRELWLAFWVSRGIADLVAERRGGAAGPRRLRQRALPVRVRPGAGHRCRQRDHRGRDSYRDQEEHGTACGGSVEGLRGSRTRHVRVDDGGRFSPLLFVPGMLGRVSPG